MHRTSDTRSWSLGTSCPGNSPSGERRFAAELFTTPRSKKLLVQESRNTTSAEPASQRHGTSGIKAERRTHDEEEPFHGGADDWGFEGRGSRGGGQGTEPEVRDLRPDLLPLEGEVRRPGGERSAAVAAVGGREPTAEAHRGRAGFGHPSAQRGAGKKVLTPAAGREAVGVMRREYRRSERRAGVPVGG